ncbi:MAG TPA: hypothetical protein VJ276_10285 [Thermoanaerobaculia bacterium]|nr:hypothetical protein [Thermoanaerobaculia bacterium]
MRAAAILLALLAALPALAEPAVYILDGGGKSIARVDVSRGAIQAKELLPFTDDATDVLAAPDGKRLVVLSAGQRRAFNASAAIVDAATMTASPRIDLGRGLGDTAFAPDGKSLLVLSPGSGGIPGTLYRIDLASAAVSKRLPLDRVADRFAIVGDDAGVVLQKGGKNANGRVSFVSLAALEVTATVDLGGKVSELVEIPGSGYLYAIETNAVDVISLAERKLVNRVTVGKDAKLGGIDEATGSLFVLGTNEQRNGMLYVLRGAALAGSINAGTGAPETFRLTADGKRALVGNTRGVTAVSLAPELAGGPTAALFSGFLANSMRTIDDVATPDGRRVFLLMRQYDKCCTLGIADPQEARTVATLQVGKTSRRVAQALLSLAATAASYSTARADAKAHGRGSFYYSVYSPAAANNPRGAFAFGPDARTIYVLDSGTDVVTAVDVETGKRLAQLDAPSAVGEVMLLGGRTIVATGAKGLTLIDSATNAVAESVDLDGDLRDVVILPDQATALALSKGRVTVIDGRAAKTTARIAGLADPVAVVLLGR